MADGIVFAGGEPDSFAAETGSMRVEFQLYDTAFSDCSLYVQGASYRATFTRNVVGRFWLSMHLGVIQEGFDGDMATVFDLTGRVAFRYRRQGGLNVFEVNTSGTATVIWTRIFTAPGNAPYRVISVDPVSREIKFFADGSEIGSGFYPAPTPFGALSYAVLGEMASGFVSQVVVSDNVNLVGSRLMTRKANAAGTYSGMTGAYPNLVKTILNDTTGVVSSTAGQMSTFGYQDVTVPTGLEMHPTVFVWNRVKNDGSSPTSMKPVIVKSGVVEKGSDLPVSEGFKAIPAVWDGMTPAIFNGAEIGMESSL